MRKVNERPSNDETPLSSRHSFWSGNNKLLSSFREGVTLKVPLTNYELSLAGDNWGDSVFTDAVDLTLASFSLLGSKKSLVVAYTFAMLPLTFADVVLTYASTGKILQETVYFPGDNQNNADACKMMGGEQSNVTYPDSHGRFNSYTGLIGEFNNGLCGFNQNDTFWDDASDSLNFMHPFARCVWLPRLDGFSVILDTLTALVLPDDYNSEIAWSNWRIKLRLSYDSYINPTIDQQKIMDCAKVAFNKYCNKINENIDYSDVINAFVTELLIVGGVGLTIAGLIYLCCRLDARYGRQPLLRQPTRRTAAAKSTTTPQAGPSIVAGIPKYLEKTVTPQAGPSTVNNKGKEAEDLEAAATSNSFASN